MSDVEDRTTEVVGETDSEYEGAAESTGVDGEVSTEEAAEAKDALQAILDDHGYDSIDELQEEIEKGRTLANLIGDNDASEVVKKAQTLDRYEAHWRDQARIQKRDQEDPDETIQRLESELRAERHQAQQRQVKEKTRTDAQKAIDRFNKTVVLEVEKSSGLSTKDQVFLSKHLGVDNPSQGVNIDSIADVRKMARSGVKEFKDLKQHIIREYLDGKTEVTKVGETVSTSAPAETSPKIMSLKEAKTAMLAKLGIK
jgi:hypothetical protein